MCSEFSKERNVFRCPGRLRLQRIWGVGRTYLYLNRISLGSGHLIDFRLQKASQLGRVVADSR